MTTEDLSVCVSAAVLTVVTFWLSTAIAAAHHTMPRNTNLEPVSHPAKKTSSYIFPNCTPTQTNHRNASNKSPEPGGSESCQAPPRVPRRRKLLKKGSVYDSSMNPFGEEDDDGSKSSGNSNKKNKPEPEEPNQNPFGDEDWETYDQPVDETKGVPVRALYDYVGQEEDELSFKAGEVFIKLLDADDQGWCTGKKDGTVGLYPNNYVEVV